VERIYDEDTWFVVLVRLALAESSRQQIGRESLESVVM